MKEPQYFVIPERNSVYKVTEDCCYEIVVFAGPNQDVAAKNDEQEDSFNSGNLLCYSCDPSINIIPTTREYYEWRKIQVNYSKKAA